MRFPFFGKRGKEEKKDFLSRIEIYKVKDMLENELEKREAEIMEFEESKRDELKSVVREMTDFLEVIRCEDVPHRLVSQAKNFIIAMKNIWKDFGGGFDEAAGRIEMYTSVRFGKYRMLSAANSQELKSVEEMIRKIAEIVKEVGKVRAEMKLPEIKAALRKIAEIEELKSEIEGIAVKIEGMLVEEERSSEREEDEIKREYMGVENRVRKLEEELKKVEGDFNKKLAMVRKPLKMYAYRVGEKVRFDKLDNMMEVSEIERIAYGALKSIAKGEIKLKEKKLDSVISALEEIASGRMREEYMKITEMKREIVSLGNELKRLESVMKSERQRKGMEEEIDKLEMKMKKLESRVYVAKLELENLLESIFGTRIEVEVKQK